MTTYAIGDVQGCSTQLIQLVDRIKFDPATDRLWFVGDLVNRGPNSLEVLRYIKRLGPAAQIVLGNHDLFLLAVAEDIATLRPKDTIQDVLATGILSRYGFPPSDDVSSKARTFEADLARRLDVQYCHACSSGTAALSRRPIE